MKKLTLSILIFLGIMMSFVSAIQIGQTITQSQLDNQDIMNTDLSNHFIRENGKVVHNRENSNEIFYVTMMSLRPEMLINETDNSIYYTGKYKVTEVKKEILVDIERWKNRKKEVGLEQAKAELKDWLIAMKERLEEKEKRKTIEYQTKTNNIDDFNLDDLKI